MANTDVQIRELAAWPLDSYTYRPNTDAAAIARAMAIVAARQAYQPVGALVRHEAYGDQTDFSRHAPRPDLLEEMQGLDWSLGLVDLTRLLAFQRRLSLHPTHSVPLDPFGPPKAVDCDATQSGNTITVRTHDPNLHLRIINGQPRLHAGSPFFEVAEYRGRWFLRDGYHRAYAMLRAGITQSPAVIVHARTLAELGATQPWFFAEDVLFSAHPPHITDFLDDMLNIEYTRPSLIKTLRVTIEETYTPAHLQAPQGDQS